MRLNTKKGKLVSEKHYDKFGELTSSSGEK